MGDCLMERAFSAASLFADVRPSSLKSTPIVETDVLCRR